MLASNMKCQALAPCHPAISTRPPPNHHRVCVGSGRHTQIFNTSLCCTELGRHFCLKKENQSGLPKTKGNEMWLSGLQVPSPASAKSVSSIQFSRPLPSLSPPWPTQAGSRLSSGSLRHFVSKFPHIGRAWLPEDSRSLGSCHRLLHPTAATKWLVSYPH